MTTTIEVEPIDSHIEVRSVEERIIYGRIVPYNQRIMVRGRPESFAPGSFSGTDITKVKLLDHHGRAIGKGVEIEERSDGAYGAFRVSKTALGDENLELAKDGVVDGLSIGFISLEQNQQGVHQRVKLMETSLVTFPAYEGAKVLAVRDKEGIMPEENTPDTNEPQAVDITVLETRMDEMSKQLDRVQSTLDAPEAREVRAVAPTPLDWFAAQAEAINGKSHERREALDQKWEIFTSAVESGNYETRALADVTGGETQAGDNTPPDDLSGLVVEEFVASQLVNILDKRRPMFASLGSFPMPRSGYAKIPVITQHVLVAGRAGQKEEANSRKMISENVTFEANWLDGAVDIALEIIATSELPVLSLVWDDMLRSYSQATEHDPDHGVVPVIEAGDLGFTYTGSALDTSSYGDFIADVEGQVDVIDDATGEPPTRLAVTRAQWSVLVAMVDANDRRLFSTLNPRNADASVGLTARSFSLPGGIEVFKVKGLTQAVLFNTDSLKAADSGPQRVEALNVALMGRDVGILGRTMLVPRIPEGVVVFGADPQD